MAFKMRSSPMERNFGKDIDSKRAQRRRDRLAKKGKLISSERLTRFGGSDKYFIEGGGGSIATDPKGKVINPTGGSSTQYKISKKGKIKTEV